MRVNWCTADAPPMVTPSPTSQCPASVALFAMVTLSPRMQSCATWVLARKKPFEPTRVSPRLVSVPTCIVTPSRMMHLSPMTRVVRPPPCLTLCGGNPSAALGNIWHALPIVVAPAIATWLIRCVPSPIRASADTVQNGPMRTPLPISAPSSITADGWMNMSSPTIYSAWSCGTIIALISASATFTPPTSAVHSYL